jgi:hypothetical protein
MGALPVMNVWLNKKSMDQIRFFEVRYKKSLRVSHYILKLAAIYPDRWYQQGKRILNEPSP